MAHPFGAVVAETLTGTRTLTSGEIASTSIFAFDPGGAGRSLVLPTAASSKGHVLFIANMADAAEVITISADSATVVTPTQAESAIVFSNGVKWFGIAGANS
jgi:hypothetical protein